MSSGIDSFAVDRDLALFIDGDTFYQFNHLSANMSSGHGSSRYARHRVVYDAVAGTDVCAKVTKLRLKVAAHYLLDSISNDEALTLNNLVLHIILNGRDFALNPVGMSSFDSTSDYAYIDFLAEDLKYNTISVASLDDDADPAKSYINFIYYVEFDWSFYSPAHPGGAEVHVEDIYLTLTSVSTGYYGHFNDEVLPDNDPVADAIKDQTEQDKQYHDEEVDGATGKGEDVNNMVSDLESGIKSKWDILWYPITFTNNVLAAFNGSSSAVYSRAYSGIEGYRYNESSGLLEPVYSRSRAAPVQSGTVITFPAYTLPGFDVQLWDAHDYDIAQIKEQVPAVFDLLYVAITILEVYWFIGFLRDKYDEVFG